MRKRREKNKERSERLTEFVKIFSSQLIYSLIKFNQYNNCVHRFCVNLVLKFKSESSSKVEKLESAIGTEEKSIFLKSVVVFFSRKLSQEN